MPVDELVSTANQADYFLDIPNDARLSLLFTLKCNWRCEHCLVSSSPERNEKMTLEQAKALVEHAVAQGTRVVYLTGGEVFLYYRELLQMVEWIRELGCHSIVETNGYWATNDERAMRKLSALQERGMDCIALSIDLYHQLEGGIERSIRIAELSKRLELPCRVIVVASLDEEADRKIVRELRERDIPYFYERLFALGRATELVQAGAPTRERVLDDRCDSVGANVLPNGDVFSCFGASDDNTLLKQTPLYVGNLFEGDAAAVLAAQRRNLFSWAIDTYGHGLLVDILSEEEGTTVPAWEEHESLCNFCQKLLAVPENVTRLERRLEQLRVGASVTA